MRLWQLDEEVAAARGASPEEQTLLDQELAQHEVDGNSGSPWSKVQNRPRRRGIEAASSAQPLKTTSNMLHGRRDYSRWLPGK